MLQKDWLMERIRRHSSSHVVHEGIPAFQEGQLPTVLDYKDIPGLRNSPFLHLINKG